MTPKLVSRIGADEVEQFPLTLGELGIPANDIVKIYTEDKVNYVHLAGDDSGDLD